MPVSCVVAAQGDFGIKCLSRVNMEYGRDANFMRAFYEHVQKARPSCLAAAATPRSRALPACCRRGPVQRGRRRGLALSGSGRPVRHVARTLLPLTRPARNQCVPSASDHTLGYRLCACHSDRNQLLIAAPQQQTIPLIALLDAHAPRRSSQKVQMASLRNAPTWA